MGVTESRGSYSVSSDSALLDLEAVHAFLSQAYWCEGIPRETLATAIHNSLCFGLYDGRAQVGFARVVTDYATYAYLCDVYVLESARGKGLGTWMMEFVMKHPALQGLRRFCLFTRDAHSLYKKFGFEEGKNPSGYLEIHRPGVYKIPQV